MPKPSRAADVPVPFLRGKKLYLRPLVESDVTDAYEAWLNDAEVTRYLEVGRYPVSKKDILARLGTYGDQTVNFIFGIFDNETGKHVGNVTLNNLNRVHGTADTGILIGEKSFWGKGYAREAWSLIIDYAFNRIAVRKVEAGTIVRNAGSEKA